MALFSGCKEEKKAPPPPPPAPVAPAVIDPLLGDATPAKPQAKTQTPGFSGLSVNAETRPEKQHVRRDDSNVAIRVRTVPFPNQDVTPKRSNMLPLVFAMPANAYAGQVEDQTQEYTWAPARNNDAAGFGGVQFNAVIQSPDISTLIVAERTGAANGPHGTRLVGLNLYHKRVIFIHPLDDASLTDMLLFPKENALFALSEAQPALEKTAELLRIDLINGEITDRFSLPETTQYSRLLGDEEANRVYLTAKAEKTDLLIFRGDRIGNGALRTFPIPGDAAINIPQSGRIDVFTAMTFSQIDVVKWTRKQVKRPPLSVLKFPLRTFIVLNETDRLCVDADGNAAILRAGDIRYRFSDPLGEQIAYDAQTHRLFAETPTHEKLQRFLLGENVTSEPLLEPTRIPPKNNAGFAHLFPLPKGQILLIDRKGVFSVLGNVRNNWKKTEWIKPE